MPIRPGVTAAARYREPQSIITLQCQMRNYISFPLQKLRQIIVYCFLWATFPKLPEALRLIEAWGFQYKTVGFVWVKTNPSGNGFFLGLGWWTRSNAEICLLAVRGKPKRQCAGISQLIISPRERHSKKPDIVRNLAVTLVGDVPRIELFARETSTGWDVWGNEVDCSITLTQSEGDVHE